MARRKTDFERQFSNNIRDCNRCETDRGQGRWITTGDGRKTIKDRSDEDDTNIFFD